MARTPLLVLVFALCAAVIGCDDGPTSPTDVIGDTTHGDTSNLMHWSVIGGGIVGGASGSGGGDGQDASKRSATAPTVMVSPSDRR